MHLIRMTLLTLLLLPLPGWSTDLILFVIQRSKNTNLTFPSADFGLYPYGFLTYTL